MTAGAARPLRAFAHFIREDTRPLVCAVAASAATRFERLPSPVLLSEAKEVDRNGEAVS